MARRLGLAGVSLGALLPSLGLAEQASPPSGSKVTVLQEVTITARHRVERVQSVPVSATIVEQKQIQALGSLNLNTIKQLVPTLTINAFNPRNISLDIRGLGSIGFYGYDGLEGGVGIYEDGVLLGRSTVANFDVPDLKDIEVLRGPQGTLFGKNSAVGAVNITTKAPSFIPQANISASYGNYNYWQLQGYASSALDGSNKAAVSLSFHATQHDGYTKSIAPAGTPNAGSSYNNQDDKGVRAQALLQPNANLSVRYHCQLRSFTSQLLRDDSARHRQSFLKRATLPDEWQDQRFDTGRSLSPSLSTWLSPVLSTSPVRIPLLSRETSPASLWLASSFSSAPWYSPPMVSSPWLPAVPSSSSVWAGSGICGGGGIAARRMSSNASRSSRFT
jgi:outer membrane receptor protein involved in Fe transport